VALAVACLAYYLYYNSFYALDLTRRDRHQAEEVVQSAFLMCQVTDRLLQKRESEVAEQVQKALSIAGYPVLLDESQPWQVAIPGSPSTDHRTLPRMAVKTASGQKRNVAILGEALRRFTGGEVTILQRVNEKGDHLAAYCSISGVESAADPSSLVPARIGTGEKEACLEKLDQGKTVLQSLPIKKTSRHWSFESKILILNAYVTISSTLTSGRADMFMLLKEPGPVAVNTRFHSTGSAMEKISGMPEMLPGGLLSRA
jgi:hypothetical protein